MATPKKAAKKVAKKAAKKSAKKSAKHSESRDVRRAYEHLGRVEILQKTSGESDANTSMLVKLAQGELKAGYSKDAADLLRAAEHLSFAALGHSNRRSSEISPQLKKEILSEIDHLTRKSQEHAEEEGERHPELVSLHDSMLKRANDGIAKGVYRQSLELARGAEALTHVFKHGPIRITAGKSQLKLR